MARQRGRANQLLEHVAAAFPEKLGDLPHQPGLRGITAEDESRDGHGDYENGRKRQKRVERKGCAETKRVVRIPPASRVREEANPFARRKGPGPRRFLPFFHDFRNAAYTGA